MDPALAIWWLGQGEGWPGPDSAVDGPTAAADDLQLLDRIVASGTEVSGDSDLPERLAEHCLLATTVARYARHLAATRSPGHEAAAYWSGLLSLGVYGAPEAGQPTRLLRPASRDALPGGHRDGVAARAGGAALPPCVELAARAVVDNPSAYIQRWIDPQEQVAWRARYPGLRSIVARILQLARDRQRLERDFQQRLEVDKLQAMRELAYGASHEINNPLANISSRAQLLLRGERDPERRRSLSTINSQAFRAHEMLADLMLFAKPPAIMRQSLDLAVLVEQVVAQLESESASGIVCRVLIDERPFAAEGDAVQLAVALRSMGQNALEAMELTGSLQYRLSRVQPLPGADTSTSWAEIEIQDTGPGLNDHERRHLFDPFFCGREAGRGLGLGLSKAWRILQLHGGQILVPSQPERGARLVVRLPTVAASHDPLTPPTTAAASAAGSGPAPDESTAAEPLPRSDLPDTSRHCSTTDSGALAPAVTNTVWASRRPVGGQLVWTVDQVGPLSALLGQFPQSLAVGAVLAAQDQHDIRLAGQLAHRLLAILRGVTDVLLRWTDDLRKPLPQSFE